MYDKLARCSFLEFPKDATQDSEDVLAMIPLHSNFAATAEPTQSSNLALSAGRRLSVVPGLCSVSEAYTRRIPVTLDSTSALPAGAVWSRLEEG